MSVEEDSKNNGGAAMPPEPEAERPEENGRPASLSSDEIQDDDETGGATDSAAIARRSRAELERKYRDDPRFNLLFHHERKLGQKGWSIKVGGIRLTVIRILILCVFLLIFLVCLGACFFYAFKDIGKYKDYARASKLYAAGDYDAAKDMFLKVLVEDPNKEDAVAAMADIYHREGNWNNETFFRQRLMRLNPLDQKLRTDFLESAFRARNFAVIYSFLNLKIMEGEELSPDESALFVISSLHSGHILNGKNYYDLKRKSNPIRSYPEWKELLRFETEE